MDSNIIKTALSNYFMFRRNHLLVMTELTISHGSIADMITINKNDFCYEIEIKTNKNDLKNELDIINDVLNKKDSYDRMINSNGYKKYLKHCRYINKESCFKNELIPKYFYFAIPIELLDVLKLGLKPKEYGIILIRKDFYKGRSYCHTRVEKKARALNNKKIDMELFAKKFMTKMTFSNNRLMNKLYLNK